MTNVSNGFLLVLQFLFNDLDSRPALNTMAHLAVLSNDIIMLSVVQTTLICYIRLSWLFELAIIIVYTEKRGGRIVVHVMREKTYIPWNIIIGPCVS